MWRAADAQTNDTTGINCQASIETTSRKHKPHQLNKETNRDPGDVQRVRNEACRKPMGVGWGVGRQFMIYVHVCARTSQRCERWCIRSTVPWHKSFKWSSAVAGAHVKFSTWQNFHHGFAARIYRGEELHTLTRALVHTKILDIWSKALPGVGTCIQPHAQTHFSPACKCSAASSAAM